MTYDARGRLLAQATGGETSDDAYTPAGLLASATLADGYRVTYSCDQTQRFIAAADNRGVLIQYILDAMGNRVREEVKDQAGNIALVTVFGKDGVYRPLATMLLRKAS